MFTEADTVLFTASFPETVIVFSPPARVVVCNDHVPSEQSESVKDPVHVPVLALRFVTSWLQVPDTVCTWLFV